MNVNAKQSGTKIESRMSKVNDIGKPSSSSKKSNSYYNRGDGNVRKKKNEENRAIVGVMENPSSSVMILPTKALPSSSPSSSERHNHFHHSITNSMSIGNVESSHHHPFGSNSGKNISCNPPNPTVTLDQNSNSNNSTFSSASIQISSDEGDSTAVDFVGSTPTVKDLFALPYYNEEDVAVALHNIGNGLLLLEDAFLIDNKDTTRSQSTANNQNIIPQQSIKQSSYGHSSSLIDWKYQNWNFRLDTLSLKNKNNDKNDDLNNLTEKFSSYNYKTDSTTYSEDGDSRKDSSIQGDKVQTTPHHPSPSMKLLLHPQGEDLMKKKNDHDDNFKKSSYVDAVLKPSSTESSNKKETIIPYSLQTVTDTLTGMMDASHFVLSQQQYSNIHNKLHSKSSPSPVCTVLDAYLDTLMKNVPELEQSLQEKGFIQSSQITSNTHNTNSASINPDGNPILPNHDHHTSNMASPSTSNQNPRMAQTSNNSSFSKRMVDTNANMLLHFLKTNCTNSNTTYLLLKNAKSTSIQLYNISGLSIRGKAKWTWWLATISNRFAMRLRQLQQPNINGKHRNNEQTLKFYRERERNLLWNALELFQEFADLQQEQQQNNSTTHMDGGGGHESLCASVCEQLADTYLIARQPSTPTTMVDPEHVSSDSNSHTSIPVAPILTTAKSNQLYKHVNIDGLTKATDHLGNGIRHLKPVIDRIHCIRKQKNNTVDYSNDSMELEAVSMQLYGLNNKLINVSLQLAEHHLRNYFSSSAMQALRTAARKIADVIRLLQPLGYFSFLHQNIESEMSRKTSTKEPEEVTQNMKYLNEIRYQHGWLWEFCGHFARSFAADELWRERGHACGDDVVSLLRDVETATATFTYVFYNENNSIHNNDILRNNISQEPISLDNLNVLVESYSIFELLFGDECYNSTYDSESHNFQERSSISKESKSKTDKNHQIKNNKLDMSLPSFGNYGDWDMAMSILDNQKQLRSDERHVLVAAIICYNRAIATFKNLLQSNNTYRIPSLVPASTTITKTKQNVATNNSSFKERKRNENSNKSNYSLAKTKTTGDKNDNFHPDMSQEKHILSVLRQRLGDACNEIGKILLVEIKGLLAICNSQINESPKLKAIPHLMLSAQHWFYQGLEQFKRCRDLPNVSLLCCNLSQCCKICANSNVASIQYMMISSNKKEMNTSSSFHGTNNHADKSTGNKTSSELAETYLQQAADHLENAHAYLERRDEDVRTWDMVSEELAATFLVLGVRRRQTLLGGGTTPLIEQSLRLTPGKERSIVEPMERAREIYDGLGNTHQSAAASYQLALFYSKVWTCQRDESKTRMKLSAAFNNFSIAHRFFFSQMRGNEPTFVILCLDLSNLYSAVSGDMECLSKALLCCLDTCDAFSQEATQACNQREESFQNHNYNEKKNNYTVTQKKEWFEKMKTLEKSVEDRIFKLLLNLVKVEKENSSFSINESRRKKQNVKNNEDIVKQTMYKNLYRSALITKSKQTTTKNKEFIDPTFYVYELLLELKTNIAKLK